MRPLWDLRAEDREEAGGKALGLARLADLGVEVPAGFVVLSSFFAEVRSRAPQEPEVEVLASHLPEELQQDLEAALDELGAAPEGYAVRSSAADEDSLRASFAGIHESYLRVTRPDVPRFLFRCWSSAFSERAMAYRHAMGFRSESSGIRMGVVVQRMLRPTAAGVVFTRDPGGAADLLIQAAEGSGDAVVRESVTPAALRVPRDGEIAPRIPEGTLPLGSAPIRELVEIALRLEAVWGCPLDVEWAVEEGCLHFLQARPMTAVSSGAAAEGSPPADPRAREDVLWTRANLRELLPDLPSPLFASFSERIDWGLNCRRLGMQVRSGDRVVRFIEGRPYFNRSLLTNPGLRLNLRQASASRRLQRFFGRARREALRLRGVDPTSLADAALVQIFRDSTEYTTEFIFHLQLAFHRASVFLALVDRLIVGTVDREAFIGAVLAAGVKSVSVQQGLDLIRLSLQARSEARTAEYLCGAAGNFEHYETVLQGTEFLPEFRAYLEQYGHRGVYESDPAMPVYAEEPGFLLRTLATLVSDPRPPDPDAALAQQEETARRAWENLRGRLSPLERAIPVRMTLLKAFLKALKGATALREQTRFEGMRVSAQLRRFLREAGARLRRRGFLDAPGDLPFLRIEEIEDALLEKLPVGDVRDRLRRRLAERERQIEIPMPDLLRESEIPRLLARRSQEEPDTGSFQGMPVGPGRVEGRVVVLESPHQLERVMRGDILVVPTLDPSWIPVFTRVAGLVVEMGGTLSHGSIIAREYGLPTVANIPGITRILKTGERVLLDGSSGTLRRLQTES